MADPTPGANSYGTAAHVAALTPVYTASGSYTTSTNPTLATVVSWIDQVSALMNTNLAAAGFVIPVTQADAKLTLEAYVEQAVADLCHAAHAAGRFFTEHNLRAGRSPMAIIRSEITEWVTENSSGLQALGATRTNETNALEIGHLTVDEGGDTVSPLFQRKAFGELDKDWNS